MQTRSILPSPRGAAGASADRMTIHVIVAGVDKNLPHQALCDQAGEKDEPEANSAMRQSKSAGRLEPMCSERTRNWRRASPPARNKVRYINRLCRARPCPPQIPGDPLPPIHGPVTI